MSGNYRTVNVSDRRACNRLMAVVDRGLAEVDIELGEHQRKALHTSLIRAVLEEGYILTRQVTPFNSVSGDLPDSECECGAAHHALPYVQHGLPSGVAPLAVSP